METIWILHMPQTRATIEIKLDRYVKMWSGSSVVCCIKIPGLRSCLLSGGGAAKWGHLLNLKDQNSLLFACNLFQPESDFKQ